ncbi:MAG: nucleotide sugar dehydrogenase [Methylobacteriaceae bacterium]|nr:nucleotide sugar dehydrogenase [Methylobacteriaceae bacterium]
MPQLDLLIERIAARDFTVGVIGLGYVGLPLACAAAGAGFRVVGFDVDPAKPAAIAAGRSYLKHAPAGKLAELVAAGRMTATTDFERLREVEAMIICVPTPLAAHREPDLSFVESTAGAIVPRLRRDHLVVLESTTWPGTTEEVVRPILESGGLRAGLDFFLAFSPEREDPGNSEHPMAQIPKIVGADDEGSLRLADRLYGSIVARTVPVTSTRTAEAVKLTENIFRAVNIALVNELKVVFDAMDINVWEVIEAAKSKPFGYMPFYPGPGLGGHCIPIDPFYLTWKAHEFGITTRFVELAGEINSAMPGRVVEKLARYLDAEQSRGLNGSRVLLIGLAYKKNVDDTRESPALRLIELLEARGAKVDFFDPHVREIPVTREHRALAGRRSVAWDVEAFPDYHAALIATDHDGVDYAALAARSALVIDTRNVCARLGLKAPNVRPA